MQLDKLVVIIIAIIIIGLIVGFGFMWSGKNTATTGWNYEKARADSILNAKVFTRTVVKILPADTVYKRYNRRGC
jgi:nitrogen fixation-related uncharacterized protein